MRKYGEKGEEWEIEEICQLPCGSSATYDGDFSFVCDHCGAIAGSVGRPQACREIDEKNEMWKKLGGSIKGSK